jgi:hypothetical protein
MIAAEYKSAAYLVAGMLIGGLWERKTGTLIRYNYDFDWHPPIKGCLYSSDRNLTCKASVPRNQKSQGTLLSSLSAAFKVPQNNLEK